MNEQTHNVSEQAAEKAFNKQAAIFDKLYSSNLIIQYKRQRVRDHVSKLIQPHSKILELNAGTGEDAIYFAQRGHNVHATDMAKGMQEKLVEKVKQSKLESKITHELCSFTELKNLQNKGPYDLIFSNFAGLNCTGELDKVLDSFSPLLNKRGIVVLVILPRFCLWESMMFLRGEFKTAFRRFFNGKGVSAQIEGEVFTCWYYNPSYVTKAMEKSFDLIAVEGLCTLVPPSYLENFPKKRPRLYNWLKEKEDKLKSKWPWKAIGDYYIISLREK